MKAVRIEIGRTLVPTTCVGKTGAEWTSSRYRRSGTVTAVSDDALLRRDADAVLDRLLDRPDEQREQQLSTLDSSTRVSARVIVLLGAIVAPRE